MWVSECRNRRTTNHGTAVRSPLAEAAPRTGPKPHPGPVPQAGPGGPPSRRPAGRVASARGHGNAPRPAADREDASAASAHGRRTQAPAPVPQACRIEGWAPGRRRPAAQVATGCEVRGPTFVRVVQASRVPACAPPEGVPAAASSSLAGSARSTPPKRGPLASAPSSARGCTHQAVFGWADRRRSSQPT